MRKNKVKYYDVSTDCYQGLLTHLSTTKGCSIEQQKIAGLSQLVVKSSQTKLIFRHNPKQQSLLIEFVEVPLELEHYHWGHWLELIRFVDPIKNHQFH